MALSMRRYSNGGVFSLPNQYKAVRCTSMQGTLPTLTESIEMFGRPVTRPVDCPIGDSEVL
jgi:hypothetical protein